MFIVRDLTLLSHNCLILESKEMQGYIVWALWGNVVCQHSVSRHMRWMWSGFKGNEVWALRRNIAAVDEKEKTEGNWIQVRQKINEPHETSISSWTEMVKWNFDWRKCESAKKNSRRASVTAESHFPELCPVHLFDLAFTGFGVFGACWMATGSGPPPLPLSPGSSEGNTIPLIWSDVVLHRVLVLSTTWGLNRGAEVSTGNKDKI